VIVSDIKQDGAERAVGNTCTTPSITSKTKDTSRLSAHNKQFSRHAVRPENLGHKRHKGILLTP